MLKVINEGNLYETEENYDSVEHFSPSVTNK